MKGSIERTATLEVPEVGGDIIFADIPMRTTEGTSQGERLHLTWAYLPESARYIGARFNVHMSFSQEDSELIIDVDENRTRARVPGRIIGFDHDAAAFLVNNPRATDELCRLWIQQENLPNWLSEQGEECVVTLELTHDMESVIEGINSVDRQAAQEKIENWREEAAEMVSDLDDL